MYQVSHFSKALELLFGSLNYYTNVSNMNSAGQCVLQSATTNLPIFSRPGIDRHTDGREERTNSIVILQEPVHFILETESVSHWLGTHQVRQASWTTKPRDSPVSGSLEPGVAMLSLFHVFTLARRALFRLRHLLSL